MTDSTSKPGSANAEVDAGAVRNAGRRRLLRAGVATAPVVLTLSSRPVLAWNCRSPSAVGSGNASNPGQSFADANTFSISGWNSQSTYPSPYTTATLFSYYFAGGTPGATFASVLGSPNGLDFEKYMVAAALNIKNNAGAGQCLTLAKLQQMWAGRSGTYCPVAGVYWNAAQIVNYLQSNWIVAPPYPP